MSQLPVNWAKCQIGEVTTIISGGTPPSKDSTNFAIDGGIPWITPADLSGYRDIYISHGARNLTEKGLRSCSAQLIPAGSVLFSTRAPIGYVAIAKNDVTTNQGFKSFVLPKELESRFIYFYLRYIKPIAEEMATGTTFKELSGSNSAKLPLLIPPLAEQKRIADKLDSLLTSMYACREHLERVQETMKRFRQAVLAAAVSGRLTEDWRKEQKRSKEWPLRKVSEITNKVGSGATPRGGEKSYKSSGIPFIRSMNVVFYGFKRDGLAFLDKNQADELRNVEVKENDVLLNITGASIGRVTLAPPDMEGARVNQHVCIIRPIDIILPEYLNVYLSAPAMQRVIGAENYGVTRQALTKEQILDFEISIPPITEQQEIIHRVETLFSYATRLEARYQAALALVEGLTPALLAKAFRGELVPQDSNDEPASLLLERIREERARQSKQPRHKAEKETMVKKMTEDSIKELIRKLPQDSFSFAELRGNLPYDNYEEIKEILFTLLAESNPCISQVFDPNAQAIRFVRRSQ